MEWTMKEVSASWRTIESFIRQANERIGPDLMLEISQTIQPAKHSTAILSSLLFLHDDVHFYSFVNVVVQVGGLLFEVFIMNSGSFKSRRAFSAECQRLNADPHGTFDTDVVQQIVDNDKRSFFMHVITTLMSRGTAGNFQMFFVSLLLNFRGLSREGMRFLSSLNCCIPVSTYDRLIQEQLTAQEEILRDCKDQPNVIWLDNFSKIYASGFQTADSGARRDCLWSGIGMRVFQGNNVDIAIRDGVDAMPDELFSESLVSSLEQNMQLVDAESWSLFEDSWVNIYDVRNVPLKPDVDQVEPQYVDALNESRDGMQSFYPLKIVPQNIGSNSGLVKIVASVWEQHINGPNMFNYQYVNADCNIFWRMCRIAYDTSGRGSEFRKTFGLTMGWWHCYKQANIAVWKFAGPHFIGPMFHALIPRHNLKQSPKLITIATHLSYIRLAYPSFKKELEAALRDPNVTNNNLRHLKNLQLLCEFFIPTVQDFGVAMKLDDGRQMLPAFARLFKLFLHFDATYANEYKKCMLLNMLIWNYNIGNDMPIWQMVSQNASVCNEEAGELAFSVLARTIGSNSSRTDIDLVNRHFILSKVKLEVAKDLNLDISDQETIQVNSHYKIPVDSPQVAIVAAHFHNVVVNLKHNFFHHYPTHPASRMYDFKNKVHADKHLISSKDEEVKEWFLFNCIPKLKELIEKTKKAMAGEWLSQFGEDWPIPAPDIADPSDDEHKGADDDETDEFVNPTDDEKAEEEKDEKANGPGLDDRGPSPPLSPVLIRANNRARPKKRKNYYWVDRVPSDDQPDVKEVNVNVDDCPPHARPRRRAMPRYALLDVGSEAGSTFMTEAKWNGNMVSDDEATNDESLDRSQLSPVY